MRTISDETQAEVAWVLRMCDEQLRGIIYRHDYKHPTTANDRDAAESMRKEIADVYKKITGCTFKP